MPHFSVDQNKDGTVRKILKDGSEFQSAIQLEQLFSIVTIYFETAKQNLDQMREQHDSKIRRRFGLQCFLMSLIGLEAFTNTYFLAYSQQVKNDDIEARVKRNHGAISKKISDLVKMAFDDLLPDHENLIQKIFDLTQLRHEIVHPRWTPSSVTFQSDSELTIQGLTENRQAVFEDEQFCREALFWCLLVIASVGQASGNKNSEGFIFHWTANYGLTMAMIQSELGIDSNS